MYGLMPETSTAAIILAAGASERMQCPKALLPFRNGETFVERLTQVYTSFGCWEIIVVVSKALLANEQAGFLEHLSGKARIEINPAPEMGRFGSVKLGLQSIQANSCFIQDVDTPFIDETTLTALYNNRNRDGYTVPVNGGRSGHPVLLGEKAIAHIVATKNVQANLREILQSLSRKEAPVETDSIHININTPKEYDRHFTNNIE